MNMRAIVVEEPGGPEALIIKDIPRPEPKPGWVLIKVMGFGLNRAELMTRKGWSGDAVKFPRVIGIECVGTVAADPDGTFKEGQRVATLMGEMGRAYDGSYAEYTLVPARQVLAIETDLDWNTFAALPEMFQTANGSLKESLKIEAGGTLFIRGGTSSVGMAAATLAKHHGLTVVATTRKAEREAKLRENGADHVVIDHGGNLNEDLRKIFPDGVDYVLELIGTKTLNDSLSMLAPGGKCCMTGVLGDAWDLNNWNPMQYIWNGTYLTAYGGHSMAREDLQEIVDGVVAGDIRVNADRVFAFDEIVQAHEYMEANKATGKVVVSLV